MCVCMCSLKWLSVKIKLPNGNRNSCNQFTGIINCIYLFKTQKKKKIWEKNEKKKDGKDFENMRWMN